MPLNNFLSLVTSNPGSPGSPAVAKDGRGGVFLGLRLALWLVVAPVIVIVGAVLAGGVLDEVQ